MEIIETCSYCTHYILTVKGGWCSKKHEAVKSYSKICDDYVKKTFAD